MLLEQAKGMLAERAKVDTDRAFRLLLDSTLSDAEFVAGRPDSANPPADR